MMLTGFALAAASILAIPSVFAAPFLAIIAANEKRWRDRLKFGAMSAACAALVGLVWLQPHSNPAAGTCYIEWDGRSNPEVCD